MTKLEELTPDQLKVYRSLNGLGFKAMTLGVVVNISRLPLQDTERVLTELVQKGLATVKIQHEGVFYSAVPAEVVAGSGDSSVKAVLRDQQDENVLWGMLSTPKTYYQLIQQSGLPAHRAIYAFRRLWEANKLIETSTTKRSMNGPLDDQEPLVFSRKEDS